MKIHHVKSSRKDYPEDDIKKGQEYWYCEPQRRKTGGVRKIRRCTKVGVEIWIRQYSKQFMGEFSSRMSEWNNKVGCLESEDEREEILEEINEFLEEKRNSLENIPYQLQESHVINEQIEELESLVSEIESEEITH